MANGTIDRVTFSSATHTTLRVMIASYFLAVALKLIPGTDLALLFAPLLPSPYAGAAAAGLVFVFSFMIMLGMATRVAALMIGLMTFYSSFLTTMSASESGSIGAFWNDLALIAALLLIYGEPELGARRHRRLIRHRIIPRRVIANHAGRAARMAVPPNRSVHEAQTTACAPEQAPIPHAEPVRMPNRAMFVHRRRKPSLRRLVTAADDEPVDNIFVVDDSVAA